MQGWYVRTAKCSLPRPIDSSIPSRIEAKLACLKLLWLSLDLRAEYVVRAN